MSNLDSKLVPDKKNRSLEKLIKKTVYRGTARAWRKVLVWALIIGFLASLLRAASIVYTNSGTAYAHVSVVYPEIADGQYPDGSRFTAYDLISEDRIQEALDVMQQNEKYLDYTASQLSRQFEVYTYTEGSVAENVISMRTEGNNYSYFANEYRLTFKEPRTDKLVLENYSEEFLNELMQSVLRNIQKKYGGADSFSVMTNVGDLSNQDYSEQVSYYRTRIGIILRYLKSLKVNSGGFVSETTGKSLMDLISHYEVFFGERLNQIDNFIQTSGITSNPEILLNKLNVRLEDFSLKGKKLRDEVETNRYATENYDHTFSENLIVVSTSDRVGLYQARPKTAFDTVVNQYNNVVELLVNCQTDMAELRRQIDLYSSVSHKGQEHSRLVAKCEELLNAFKEEYEQLCAIAANTVADYLADINEAYISYKVNVSPLVSSDVIVDAALTGIIAATLVFVIYIICSVISDFFKVCGRKRKLKRMSAYREKWNAMD